MSYWTIAALVVTVTLIAFERHFGTREALPQWLRPARRRKHAADRNGQLIEPAGRVDSEESLVKTKLHEPLEEETTPKAAAAERTDGVPALSLDQNALEENEHLSPKPETRGSSTPYRVQQNSLMPPPPAPPQSTLKRSAGLMPPPPRPTSTAASLRVPTTGPLPNRGPPTNSQQRISSSLSVNGAVPTPNARGKVLLAPGHSPMDWAALTRRENLSGVTTFQRVTPSTLKSMTGRKGKPAWSSFQGKVYNITPYLPFHPGGTTELMRAAGRDGTELFMEVHPWVNWENMLSACLVGVMVPEDFGSGSERGGSSLEDMD